MSPFFLVWAILAVLVQEEVRAGSFSKIEQPGELAGIVSVGE
jgi:hypothetical protein